MTLQEILGLSLDQLSWALKAYGLLPREVIEPTCPAHVLWIKTPEGYETWAPQSLIAHAWSFVEVWGLTIERSHDVTRGAWWVGQWGISGDYAATFADIPAAICRVALLLECRRYFTLH